MSRDCCCSGGRCGDPQDAALSRREFIGTIAAGAAGLAMAGELAWANASGPGAKEAPLTVPKRPQSWNYPITPPRVYQGKNLEAVSMPIGGIGTGSIWLDGQGRLAVWQIFNNLSEIRIPDSFFAVRVRSGNGKATVRVLQTAAEGPLKPVT